MIKTLLLVLATAIAAVLVYAAFRPATIRVERRLLIAAPPATLFPLMDDLHAFNRWNPYRLKDPTLTDTFEGPSSGPGAVYRWKGNKGVGQGSMTITEHTPMSQVVIRLQILEPFPGDSRVEFNLKPQGAGTEVTWALQDQQAYIPRLMGIFFNMDKLIGDDFAIGLERLRKLAEAG